MSPTLRKIMTSAAGLALAGAVAGGTSAWAAPGNVKVDTSATPSGNANHPHVTCPVYVDEFGITGSPTFELVAPTGAGVLAADADPAGGWDLEIPANVTPQPQQGFHIRVSLDGKSKVVWVQDCTVPPTSSGGPGPVT